MNGDQPHLVLIGGGHSHLAVLADLIANPLTSGSVSLISRAPSLRYSGMVPGWISGEYASEEGLVDLVGLARRAGVTFVEDTCVGIDPVNGQVVSESGQSISYDWCSINAGGVGRGGRVLGDDPRLVDVRPIDGFVERMAQWEAGTGQDTGHIAVVGGGAGGVELAFALRNRGKGVQARISLVTGRDGLLPAFGSIARRLVLREMSRQSIQVIAEDARLDSGQLMVANTSLEPVDLIVTALGSGAPVWPGENGLATDAAGFIAVDRFQRSISHPNVFAAGDIAARTDRKVTHSGVHAVHTGPILAANLRAVMTGRQPTRSYRPRPTSLYLLATGRGEAIASYGPLAAQGLWAQKLKQRIDKRWIAAYAKLAQAV